MSDMSARLGLPLIAPSQAQKHVTHNEALQRLDAIVQLVFEDVGAETPPGTPDIGALWALGPAPTGAWVGQGGMLAQWVDPAWHFLEPQDGWRGWDRMRGLLLAYGSGFWQEVVPLLQSLDGVGIGTGSDAVNRLAVAAEATLFSHEGAGHQLKINKAATAETASLLYQADWTGHAELGLTGDNDFHLKVSADGGNWTEALVVDAADGHVSGASVQAGPLDVTPGRLMRADYGYAPGNLLGPVSQSGGAPTGAVIERGSTSDGDYVRFADGTQICHGVIAPDFAVSGNAVFAFPAAFSTGPAGGVTGVGNGSAIAIANFKSIEASGAISATQFFVHLNGTGSNGTGAEYQLSFMFIGRWF